MTENIKDDLKERVDKFNILQLPGQPMSMHMGTSYLVNDLWREVQRLRKEISDHRCTLPDSIQEALNSGDGVYRP